MRAIPRFVILSLVACKGGESRPGEPHPNDAAVSAASAGIVDTLADAQTRDPEVSQPASHSVSDTVFRRDTSARAEGERKPVRLVEYRGDALSPVPYRVVEPDDAKADTPIVLALHGRGDTAAGFMGLARRLELDARVIVAEAPLPFGNIGGRQWFDAATADALRLRLDELDRLLETFAARHPEAGRPILLGFSQGAMLVMLALAERPERYRAGVALSGRLVERPDAKPSAGAVETDTPKVPVLVVAGTKDGIIPQEASWSAADELARLGREVERFGFVGAHSVPPAAIEAVRIFVAKVTAPTGSPPPTELDAKP